MIARPGHPHDDIAVSKVKNLKIDSGFIGSCTNGRIEDLHVAASFFLGKRSLPGGTENRSRNRCYLEQALKDGIIKIFKDAGALVSNAGCAGCAAGQVGQKRPGEVTISTGNRNFEGKQGKGFVYLHPRQLLPHQPLPVISRHLTRSRVSRLYFSRQVRQRPSSERKEKQE